MISLEDKILRNAPTPVNFAGLRGTTYSLQATGWELAVEAMASYHRRGYEVRLAGRHRGLGLRILSMPTMLDMRMLEVSRFTVDIEFNIRVAAESLNFNIVENRVPKFEAVDFSNPYMDIFDKHKYISLEDCCFFKPMGGEETTIYVPEKEIWTMEKHLTAVRTMQADKQAELREKYRKRDYRKEGEEASIVSDFREVKLQLIAV